MDRRKSEIFWNVHGSGIEMPELSMNLPKKLW